MDKWSLRDVVLLAFLASLFGGVFMGADAIYAVLAAALTPLGYAPFANEILFGMWVMAAPMTTMLLRKKGVQFLVSVWLRWPKCFMALILALPFCYPVLFRD